MAVVVRSPSLTPLKLFPLRSEDAFEKSQGQKRSDGVSQHDRSENSRSALLDLGYLSDSSDQNTGPSVPKLTLWDVLRFFDHEKDSSTMKNWAGWRQEGGRLGSRCAGI